MSDTISELPSDLAQTFPSTLPDNWPEVMESRAAATHLGDTKGTVDLLRATAVYLRALRSGAGVVKALSLDSFAMDLSSAMQRRGATVRGLSAQLGIDKSAMSRARTGKAIESRHFIALWNWMHSTSALTPAYTPNAEQVSDEKIASAMLDAWNEICLDTGCHPLDIERHGKTLTFTPNHWARFVAMRLRAALGAK